MNTPISETSNLLANLIFVSSFLSTAILVCMGVARESRGVASPETEQALRDIGQWKPTDQWGGSAFFILAALSLVVGFSVKYWM